MKSLFYILTPLLLVSCANLTPKQQVKQELEEAKACPYERFNRDINGLIFQEDLEAIKKYTKDNKVDFKNERGLFCNTLTHESVRFPLGMKYFVEQGSPVDEINSFQNTPLSEAVEANEYESAKYLLEKGARVNLKHSFDNPLLFLALRSDNPEMMLELLMEYGACPLDKGFMDKTLEEAAKSDKIKQKLIAYRTWFIKHKKTCTPKVEEKDSGKKK